MVGGPKPNGRRSRLQCTCWGGEGPAHAAQLGLQLQGGVLQRQREGLPRLGHDGEVGGRHLVGGELVPGHEARVVRPGGEGDAHHRGQYSHDGGPARHAQAEGLAEHPAPVSLTAARRAGVNHNAHAAKNEYHILPHNWKFL